MRFWSKKKVEPKKPAVHMAAQGLDGKEHKVSLWHEKDKFRIEVNGKKQDITSREYLWTCDAVERLVNSLVKLGE